MRIATVTMAAPWPGNLTVGTYNRHQADGLNRIGHHCEVFVISPSYPRVFERLRPSLKRLNDRPKEYEFMDVKFHVFKGWVAHPVSVRWKVSPRFPKLGESLIHWSTKRRLIHALREYKPEGLIIHDTVLNGALGMELSRELGVPYVLIDHDPIDIPPESRLGRRFREVASEAKVIFNVGLLGHLHERNEMKLPNARLIPNGTVKPGEEQWKTPRPARWEGKKVVLIVGLYIERKGHKEMLRAFAELNMPDTLLVVVGEPPQHIKDLVKELKIEDKVEFTPRMSQQEVQQYMVWADLFCLPSWWECAALVYIEAMCAETPPIMTEDCGLTYVVEQGVNGWVVPPQDHQALVATLREALTTADLAAMGQRGRAMAEQQFVWTRNAEMIVAGLRGEPDPMPPLPTNLRLPSFKPSWAGM